MDVFVFVCVCVCVCVRMCYLRPFNKEVPAEVVHTTQTRQVILNPEPHFWFALVSYAVVHVLCGRVRWSSVSSTGAATELMSLTLNLATDCAPPVHH